MTNRPPTAAATAYIALFENLSREKLQGLEAFVHPDIHFVDPFNDLRGLQDFVKLLVKTLEDVQEPAFKVSHQAWAEEVLFLRWTFKGKVKALGDWQVTGMSELHFAEDGRVLKHIDHWDAGQQFYARLPLIGSLIRLIARRLRVS